MVSRTKAPSRPWCRATWFAAHGARRLAAVSPKEPTMTDLHTPHADLHSEVGAVRGDRPARARNPVIKVRGIAWVEFAKPDLDAAERFAHDFGFATAARSRDTL